MSYLLPRPALALTGITGLLSGALALGVTGTAAAAPASTCIGSPTDRTVTCTYLFTGAEQQFAVPAGVTSVDVTAIGGLGGAGLHDDGEFAQAGVVTGTLDVTGVPVLYLQVGGQGGAAASSDVPGAIPGGEPGFNGGAWGGSAEGVAGEVRESGAGGGGASDVRTVSRDDADTLGSRLLVAGGGGGGAEIREGGWAGLNGWTFDGWSAAEAGQADRGGAAGDLWSWFGSNGELGAGGTGRGVGSYGHGGGGGGGGLYGGGGGAMLSSGAGGSSLVPDGGTTGWSTDPATITVTYLPTAPPAPGDVSVQRGNGSATVSWSPVTSSDPNAPVTGYRAVATPLAAATEALAQSQVLAAVEVVAAGDPGPSCTTTTATSCTILGLTNGVGYSVEVTALNLAAASSPGEATDPVVPAGPPIATGDPSVTVGSGTITVSFTAADGNGSPVSRYTATATDVETGEQFTATGSSSPLVITGVADGRSYRVTLTVTNDAGTTTALELADPVRPVGVDSPTVPTTAVTGSSAGSLASTGADISLVLPAAVALLVGGAGLTALGTRTRRSRTTPARGGAAD